MIAKRELSKKEVQSQENLAGNTEGGSASKTSATRCTVKEKEGQ